MNATCSICLDSFSDQPETPPIATHCGHLYCLTCATFHFANPGMTCAVCRTPQGLDNLIKLYPTYDNADGGSEGNQTRPPSRLADPRRRDLQEITKQIIATFQLLDTEGLEFSKEGLLNTISCMEELVDVLDGPSELVNLLDKTVILLKRLSSGVENVTKFEALREDRKELKAALRHTKNKLKDSRSMCDEQRRAHEEAFRRLHLDAQTALEAVVRELSAMKTRAATDAFDHEQTVKEEKRWRQAATKYKKKYYALKQKIRVHGNDSDQSLEIV